MTSQFCDNKEYTRRGKGQKGVNSQSCELTYDISHNTVNGVTQTNWQFEESGILYL